MTEKKMPLPVGLAGLVLAYAESSTDPRALKLAIKIRIAFEYDLREENLEMVTLEEMEKLPESTLTTEELIEEAIVVFDLSDPEDQGALDYYEALLASIGVKMLDMATQANNRSMDEVINNLIGAQPVANTEATEGLSAT